MGYTVGVCTFLQRLNSRCCLCSIFLLIIWDFGWFSSRWMIGWFSCRWTRCFMPSKLARTMSWNNHQGSPIANVSKKRDSQGEVEALELTIFGLVWEPKILQSILLKSQSLRGNYGCHHWHLDLSFYYPAHCPLATWYHHLHCLFHHQRIEFERLKRMPWPWGLVPCIEGSLVQLLLTKNYFDKAILRSLGWTILPDLIPAMY